MDQKTNQFQHIFEYIFGLAFKRLEMTRNMYTSPTLGGDTTRPYNQLYSHLRCFIFGYSRSIVSTYFIAMSLFEKLTPI